jgi:hypothetical protein
LIGEGYKVAAEDVRALSDAFPEVLANATVLADGTVKLNEGVVQTVLGG